MNPDFEARMPSKETIQKFGWIKYEIKTIE